MLHQTDSFLLRLQIVCLYVLFSATTLANAESMLHSKIAFEERPDWVFILDRPTPSEENLSLAQDGIHYILTDNQVNIEDNYYEFYRRFASKIINQSGLEDAAKLEFSFDPSDEHFTIHAVSVTRDGQVFDRLDPDLFQVFRQEADLANGVTDGRLTIYAQLPDIRVGDTIEYEFSRRVSSKIWPGEFYRGFSAEWSVPLEMVHERYLVPTEKPLIIKTHETDSTPTITNEGDKTSYVWTIENPEPVASISNRPSDHVLWGFVSVSTFPSWAKVVESLVGDYTDESLAANLPPLSFLQDEDAPLNHRITEAIRYVQDDIRYVADEEGIGSHIPRSPMLVIERGWGDCKDKSALLTAILKRMGVTAYVALTDLDSGFRIPLYAPSPGAFDHAVVAIEYNGQRHWIDPTSNLQGGVFPKIQSPNYGFGLALLEGNQELWEIPASIPELPRTKVSETFDFANLETTGVTLRVESIFAENRADNIRRSISSNQKQGLAENYLSFYQEFLPGLETADEISINDDRDKNRITVIESYKLPSTAFYENGLETAFILKSSTVNNVIDDVAVTSRTAPISVPFPIHKKHTINIENPPNRILPIESDLVDEPEFFFKRTSKAAGDGVKIDYTLKTLKPTISVDRAKTYKTLVTAVDDWSSLEYDLSEDETETTPLEWAYLIISIALIVSFIGLCVGASAAIKADNLLTETVKFHPVSISKFVAMTITTFGLYSVFWMFRCWRWVRVARQERISAAARTFFSVFFFLPLTSRIAAEFDDGKKPSTALRLFLFIGFLTTNIGFSIAEHALEDDYDLTAAIVSILSVLSFLWIVPLVNWVNKLNHGNGIIKQTSAITLRTLFAIAFGLSFWGFVLLAYADALLILVGG